MNKFVQITNSLTGENYAVAVLSDGLRLSQFQKILRNGLIGYLLTVNV